MTSGTVCALCHRLRHESCSHGTPGDDSQPADDELEVLRLPGEPLVG